MKTYYVEGRSNNELFHIGMPGANSKGKEIHGLMPHTPFVYVKVLNWNGKKLTRADLKHQLIVQKQILHKKLNDNVLICYKSLKEYTTLRPLQKAYRVDLFLISQTLAALKNAQLEFEYTA